MVAIHTVHYNYARIHKSLRITPSVAANLSDHVWSLEEMILMGTATREPRNHAGLTKSSSEIAYFLRA
jgi:hypothetical protein